MLGRDKYLSEEEAKKLRSYAEAKALQDLEHGRRFYVQGWAVLDTLLSTGIRASECRLLQIKDLSLGKEPSVTVLGKGQKKRTVPISSDLRKHLKDYLAWKRLVNESVDLDSYVFLNRLGRYYSLMGIQGLFKKLAREAGLKSVYSIHSTRHTYGFLTYGRSKNLRLTQVLLGHSSPVTTQVYAHVNPLEIVETVNSLW